MGQLNTILRQLLPALALVFAAGLHAQESESEAPAPPAEPPPPSVTVSTAELASRADEINADVLGVLRGLQEFDERLQTIPGAREQLGKDLETLLAGFGPEEIGSLSLSDAESLQQTLLRMTKQLDGWRGQLNARIDELELERGRLRESQAFLEESLGEADELAIPASLRERIDGLIIQLSATRQVISARTSVVLDELSAISNSELRIRDVSRGLEEIIVRGPAGTAQRQRTAAVDCACVRRTPGG